MKSLPILIIALLIAVFVPHVCADNVTYPQEYYDMTTNANIIYNKCVNNGDFVGQGNWPWCNTYIFQEMTSQREKAIQLALEKQNELINEQNAWLEKLLNQTYSLHLSFLSEDGGNHLIKPNL